MAPRLEEQEQLVSAKVLDAEDQFAPPLEEPYPIINKPVKVPLPFYVDGGKMILKSSNNRFWNFASWCAVTSCVLICKLFLNFCTSTTVYNKEPFLKELMDPNRTRPILTVANHLSTVDDPLIWGSLPIRTFLSLHRVRWTLGAQEICFSTTARSKFFSLGQVVPTVRGAGIYQPAMNFALDRLNEGKWVHIFPEGKINQTADMIRFKWGIGRLLMETTNLPIVVPIWHKGLEEIMPEDREHPWIPKFGKKVVIAYGNPMDFKDLLTDYHEGRVDEVSARISITDAVFRAMDELQKKAESLAGKSKNKTL
ncbi:Telomere length regulator taz1 [Glomus cerebriforme]|uniref:Tafazzin family protein n=1 Tax=Glomus cerebriforme TaxID=658196 RepID=A0A397TGL4_9GLOM|nr:Telomere length regulator taz1 [Glomus cerebriforme]